MTYRRALLAMAALAAACSIAPARPLTLAQLPDVDTKAALGHIKALASDEFEGRLPGTKGEGLTVQYLTDQFKAAGLEPGNPDGTFVQKVPLVGITPSGFTSLVVKKGGQAQPFKHQEEVVAFSQRVTDAVSVSGSDIVFVGYGVEAPEYQWNDFKDMDVKGKTIVMLVNDPPVPDPKTFGGKAMTYYGRWTYKYEKAAEKGAAAVFVVHETPTAGYGWNVVQGFGGERFDLITPDKNMGRAAIQGWLSLEAATRLFKMAGQDYQALKAQAATREFKPVPFGLTASMSFKQSMHMVDSKNVIAKLTGSDPTLKNEYVILTAHWDHLGIGDPKNPKDPKDTDKIYNGAADNASGTAALLEIARAMKALSPAPKRSILFLAVTAEEQGLLGSEYYAKFPLYPLNKTLANINTDDNLPMWGRTKDVIVIGLGASDLDDYLRDAAGEQTRSLFPDAEPEKGFYYRSDHFNFAKVGVPALAVDDGVEYVGKPPGFGRQQKDDYTANDYHSPSDDVKPDWDLAGFAEQAKLFLAVCYRVAQADKFPEWKPGNEFRAIREKSMGAQ